MSFKAVCPSCGSVYRLLDRYEHTKITCVDCRKPFVAENARSDYLDVPAVGGTLPDKGWLLVCPACSHTQLIGDGSQLQTHCAVCGTALVKPAIPSKPIRCVLAEAADTRSQ